MKAQLFYPNWDKLQKAGPEALYSVMRGELADDPSVYELIWEGDIGVENIKVGQKVVCEYLFEEFNIGKRKGLQVRSMSVGDVVCVHNRSGEDVFFVCSNAGFRELEGGL